RMDSLKSVIADQTRLNRAVASVNVQNAGVRSAVPKVRSVAVTRSATLAPSIDTPMASGVLRASSQLNGARPSSKSQPRPAQADRPPSPITDSPRPPVPAMTPTASSTVNTPIAGPSRRVNHLPTRDILTSESAPWPKPRTSSSVTNNIAAVDATLIPKTASPN